MEILEDIMTAEQPIEEEEEEEVEKRGRPRALKSYITESNSELPSRFTFEGGEARVFDTGLPELKVLCLRAETQAVKDVVRFYVDMQDPRFWVLHTPNLAEDVNLLYRSFVDKSHLQLDRAWIPSEMLERISSLPGNAYKGFGLRFTDILASREEESPIEELTMAVSGRSSSEAISALRESESIRRSISYERLRVQRGAGSSYTRDDVSFNGRFIVLDGTSADNHIGLVNSTRTLYKTVIEEVEQSSIGVEEVEGRTLFKGQAYDLEFEREVPDYDVFLKRLLDPSPPFRLWGIKVSKDGETRRVVAVDLHTGQPIDLEVAPSLIRVYIPQGSCGNTLMRLYVNLQHNFDSRLTLRGLDKLSL